MTQIHLNENPLEWIEALDFLIGKTKAESAVTAFCLTMARDEIQSLIRSGTFRAAAHKGEVNRLN